MPPILLPAARSRSSPRPRPLLPTELPSHSTETEDFARSSPCNLESQPGLQLATPIPSKSSNPPRVASFVRVHIQHRVNMHTRMRMFMVHMHVRNVETLGKETGLVNS